MEARKYIPIFILFLTIALGVLTFGGYVWFSRYASPKAETLSPVRDIPQEKEGADGAKPFPEPVGERVEFPLELPEGFSIRVFAKNLGAVRVLRFDPDGVLVVSITKEDKVVLLPDRDGDGMADAAIPLAEGTHKRPHGLAFRDGFLYIAESDRVSRLSYKNQTVEVAGRELLFPLPNHEGHFTRTIDFDRNGNLYTSVGSSCNVCTEKDWRRAKILVSEDDGSDLRVFALGLRNAVFFIFHPETDGMWATEMGRDFLGDELPPDEIDIVREGKDYGWPFCYGGNVHDIDFDKGFHTSNPCQDREPSFIDIPAHSSPLGLRFIPKGLWGDEFDNDLLVALHGSWNRSSPVGYKIVRYHFENGALEGTSDFISGWLASDGSAWGRPVDLLFGPDGTLYISDDKAGVVYRVFKE